MGVLPGISTTPISPTLSPGGNAGNLFPTLQPSPGSSPSKNVKGRAVADSTALPEGASVVGASLIGLAALALAFVLAVTRFSIRRRPAPSAPGAAAGQSGSRRRLQGPEPTARRTGSCGGCGGSAAGRQQAPQKRPQGTRGTKPPSDAARAP